MVAKIPIFLMKARTIWASPMILKMKTTTTKKTMKMKTMELII